MKRMTGLAASLVLAGCSFEVGIGARDDASIDVAPDASTVGPYWVVAGMSRGAMPLVRIFPFDGVKLTTPCAEQPSTTASAFAIRDLLPHGALPVVYAVDAGFRSLSVTCGAITFAGDADVGGVRPIQQIVRDPASGVGFFTADGMLATGVYRFVTGTDGTPAVTGSANAPSSAGALALDAVNGRLFVAGPMIVGGYTLGGALDLPSDYDRAGMCLAPMRLVTTGANVLLAFCNDEDDIRRYTRIPFAADATMPSAGVLGAVDQVIPLPGDRVVAARKAPKSDLVVVSNNGGTPTWGAGTPVLSRVLAMGASSDGRVIATARVTGTMSTELAVWRIDDNTITLLDVRELDAVVNALTVTTPGT